MEEAIATAHQMGLCASQEDSFAGKVVPGLRWEFGSTVKGKKYVAVDCWFDAQAPRPKVAPRGASPEK